MHATSKEQVAAAAVEMGFDGEALARLAAHVARDVEAMKYDGARIMAARRGVTVLDLTIGYAHRDSGRKLVPDAVFSIMSISKVMTAVALMRCVERGQISLLTPVAAIIPEFGKRGKELVTVGQILTHTAGMGMATGAAAGRPTRHPREDASRRSANCHSNRRRASSSATRR